MSEIPSVAIHTRKEWREWLRKNHKKESRVHLVSFKKHTGKISISHREAMGEAICFGWIDTTIKRLCDGKYQRTFVRRGPNARWSSATQGYAKELIKKRRMAKAGLEAYTLGLRKPVIDHGLPKNPDIPLELRTALAKNRVAKENFKNFSPSTKRYYIYWIMKAVRPETKERRVKAVVERAALNKKITDPN